MLLLKQTIILMVLSSYLVLGKPTIDYCSTCQSVSEFVQDMQRNQTESVMKTNLYKLCLKENDGSNSRVCVFLATTMQNTLKHIADEEFCSKINACPSRRPFNKAITINEERCEFCINLLESSKSLIADSNSDLVKESLNYYCELTGDFKEECQKNLNKNLVNFLDFAQNKMDSEQFCHVINSCHYQTVEEKKLPQIGDLLSLRDPNQMAGHLDFIDEHKLAIPANDEAVGGALSCMVCRQVIVMIYSSLHKNATREHVEHLLAKSCKTIYFKNKDKEKQCEEKIVKNAEIILNSFINHVPPDLVCLLTGMCLPGQLNEEVKPLPALKEIEPKVSNQISIMDSVKKGLHLAQDYKCYFCEKIVQFLFRELDQTKTREYIKHLLDRSCDTLFDKEEREAKCEEYVNAYTDKLIDLIEKASNPGLICNTLHMCPVNYAMITAWDNKRLNSQIVSKPTSPVESKNKRVVRIDWCSVCKRTFPLLSEAMQIDVAKEKMIQYAHSFCDANILPIKDCRSKVDEYIEIIATVKDNVIGCQNLTLCPVDDKRKQKILIERDQISLDLSVFDLASVDPSLGQQLNQMQQIGWWADTKCSACKLLIKGVYANLNKTIHSESTRRIIEQTCEHLHQDELKEKCKQDAIKALETLVKDITQSMPPEQACELMNYCKKKGDFDYSTATKTLAQSSVCNTCKVMFPILHPILQNENVRKQVENVIAKACDQCQVPEKCNKRLTEIIDDIANNEDSNLGCSSLCKDNLMALPIHSVSECTVCQTSMVVIDQIFKNEHVKSRLNDSLENFCDSRGENVQHNCKSIVRKNLPKLFDLVQNLTDHDNGFCPSMGFCNSKKKDEHSSFISFDLIIDDDLLKGTADLIPDENELLNDPFFISNNVDTNKKLICDGCKKIMGEIQKEIKDNEDLKDKVLRELLKTCPKGDDKCREFYRKYINYLYKLMVKNTDPDRACPLMKLCPDDFTLNFPNESEEEFQPAINLTESTICKECQSAIQYLVHTLNNKTVVDFILQEVQKNVCGPLSFIERKACTRLVKSFGPKIVAHFVQRITEDKICTRQLKLCKDEFDNFISLDKPNEDMDFDLINFVEDPNCVICTRSVNKLNALRGESSKKHSIEEICGDDSECRQFMLDFQNFFLNNDYNQDSILSCNELDICLIPGKAQLLGGFKCQFGPAYSCLSSAHAEACRNTKFCQQNYWKAVEN